MISDMDAREDRLLQATREYQAALEAGRPPERRTFLARFPDLAEELDSYLDALDSLQGLAATADGLSPNTPLGDFRIVREIGRGGMGIVYEAEQLSLGRRVALKVLSFAGALDPRQLQRFRTEAQAAAHLHHSNIVPVYAVGSDRGVHFYAMQLIEGRSLADVITRLREEDQELLASARTTPHGATARASTTGRDHDEHRRLAGLMEQAALALEHAHQQGVIHRDIKPANLLLDPRGHLWIADFGLAQVQDGIDLTRTGDLVGTLRYMSPEQASGQHVVLDQRTDVYSLGATFYELLTLSPLFTSNNRAELVRQIACDEPRPLRSIRRDIPFELETIVLKCLSKLPGERYASARDLADDLQRYLQHRPILARRPGLIERASKWSRRHPGLLAGLGLVLLLSTVGLLVSHALVAREQARTEAALAREHMRAEQAERRLQQTRQLVELLIQIGEEELDDRPSQAGLRRRLLETGLAHYQKLLADSTDDASASADLTSAADRVRATLADLVTLQGAEFVLMLGSSRVLDDLAPSAEQRTQLSEVVKRLNRDRMQALFSSDLSLSDKKQKLVEIARSSEQAIRDLLNPSQRSRLEQISLQMKGPHAFREQDVESRLQLTVAQKQRLRELELEFAQRPGPGPGGGLPGPLGGGPGGPPGKGPGRKLHESQQRERMQRTLGILTPAQKKTWENMIGKPVTFSQPFGPPQGRPPR